MGGIIRGDFAEATDVMVPEQGNAPAPQVQEQGTESCEQDENINQGEEDSVSAESDTKEDKTVV